MKTEFICANHRQWLRERPSIAFSWWEKSFDAGKYYQEMHLWEESVRPLGCAFETATICLEQARVIDAGTIDRLSRSAQCLTYSLLKLGQHPVAYQIVSGVEVLVKNLDGRIFDRQKMLDMQRKLHLFLAAHPAITQESTKSKSASDLLSHEKVVSIH